MKSILTMSAVAGAMAAMLASGPSWAATTSTTLSYMGQGANATTCNTKDSIDVVQPSAAGKYPVFVYTVGTTETFTNTAATALVQDMANAGFIAATVNYATATFGNCANISGKAECIYNSSSSTSAITALCGLPNADCAGKGIYTSGGSQGAVIATLAKNFDANVQAVYGIADGVMYTAAFNLTSCMANGNRTLASSNLIAVNGVADQFTGDTEALQQTNMQSLTGFTCPTGSISCIQPNGSGWIIVQQDQVSSGAVADHCYPRTGGCNSSQNSIQSEFLTGTADWTAPPNLAFLQNMEQSFAASTGK